MLVGGRRGPGGPPQDSRFKRHPSSSDSGRCSCGSTPATPLSPPAGLCGPAQPLRGRGAPGGGRRPVEQSGCAHKRGYHGQSEAASAMTCTPRARSIYRSYLKSPWESPRARLGGGGGGGGGCGATVRPARVRWRARRCRSRPFGVAGRGGASDVEPAHSMVVFTHFPARFLEREKKYCSFNNSFA